MTHINGATNQRILPRYTQHTKAADPLELAIAQHQAQQDHARTLIAAGRTPDANPQDLRGIPVIARGVGGTSPGTNPATAINHLDHRLAR